MNTKKHYITQGHCPKCGSDDINYGISETSGESIYYEGDCNDCGSDFHEWYDLKFSGMDLMLQTDDGFEVEYFNEGDDIFDEVSEEEKIGKQQE